MQSKYDSVRMIIRFEDDPTNTNYRPNKQFAQQVQPEFDIDPAKYKKESDNYPRNLFLTNV